MASPVKYMIDESGEKTSVLIPIKTWEKMQQDYAKLHNKFKVLTGVKEGLKEVKDSKKNGKKLETLRDYLRESSR